MSGHTLGMSWPTNVAVLHGRAPRTRDTTPQCNGDAPWDSVDERCKRPNSRWVSEVIGAGTTHTITALTVASALTKGTAIISAELKKNPLDHFPSCRDKELRGVDRRALGGHTGKC